MNLSKLSVRRGVTFGMIYLMIVGFGLFSLGRLQLDLWPELSFPAVMVLTNYTGASPEDIETLVTRPLEGAVSSVKNVEELKSTSKNGISVLEIGFEWGADMEQAETEVRRSIEMIEGFLPEDADAPMIFAFDTSLQPIVGLILTGPYPLEELRRIAVDDIQPRVERLPGIASVEVAGGLEREIHVYLDPTKVESFGLDVNNIVAAVYRENRQEPGGAIEQGPLDFTIQAQGKYRTVAEIREVLVGIKQTELGPAPLRLGEVAEVEDSFYESQRVIEVNGKPSVWLMVRKQSGANTVRAAEGVVAALPAIARGAGANLEFRELWNLSTFIKDALGNLSSTALAGVAISFFVLLFFLRNIRSALIVSTAIPLSVVATFGVMDQANMSLNILSMAGLALAVGMLVDNAIVVLENVFRLREQGVDACNASIDGARTVSIAVTASTLTTVSVFVPILFVPGIAGVMFEDMAVTICFALSVSLLVALTFIPLAASRLLGSERAGRLLVRARGRSTFAGLREGYGRTLDWVLGHRWVVALVLLGVFTGTGLIAMALPTEFIMDDDQSQVFISAEAPVGTNLEESTAMMREVVAVVEQVVRPEERKLVAIDGGVGKGFVSIFSKGVHAATIRVPLVAMGQRARSQKQIETALAEALVVIPGLTVSVGNPFNMVGGEGDMEVEIFGHDLDESRRIGMELRGQLLAWPEVESAKFSMEDKKPEVRIVFDRRKMAELGISSAAVSGTISTYFMGRTAARFAEGGDEYDIVVRYAKAHRQDIDELRRMPILTMTGQSVPLSNVAQVSVGLGPVDITRLDQGRVTRIVVTLASEYTGPDGAIAKKDLGASIAKVRQALDRHPWPEGFVYDIGGTAEDFEESMRYMGVAFMVSVLLVFMVMASLFESFRQPFIIILTTPLAAVGVVLMFSLTQSTVDMTAMIGVIMLVGIVVNNGIVMVDAANQLREEEGLDRRTAIAKASRLRLRPVLMTSLTTIMAMVPLALEIGEGSAGWAGMAKAVIGGLLASTFFTLYVVPTVYTLFAPKKTPKKARMEAQIA